MNISWNKFPLSDIAEVFNGKTPSNKEKRSVGHPVLKIKDISEDGQFVGSFDSFVDDSFFEKYKEKRIRFGDTLILNASHSSEYVGTKACFANNDITNAVPTGEWLIVRPLKQKAVYHYVFYFLVSSYGRYSIKSIVKGIHLYPKDVAKIKIPLPPLGVQKKIAAVLDKADRLRQLRKTAIEKLDQLTQSVFLDMFGNPVTNPKEWKYVCFGDIIDALTDYHANGSYKVLRENVKLLDKADYALMVRTTDLERNNFTKNVKYITKDAYEFLSKSKVYGGEIIINKIGSAGSVYLMPNLNRPVSLGMNQFLIRVNDKEANNVFIYYLLISNYGKTIIERKVRGAVTKTITKDSIRSLEIPLPDITLQNKFASILEHLDKQKETMKSSLEKINETFNSILQRAFKGELEFNDDYFEQLEKGEAVSI